MGLLQWSSIWAFCLAKDAPCPCWVPPDARLLSPQKQGTLPTCPGLPVQPVQHSVNVEKGEAGLHGLGCGAGIGGAPGKERAGLG